MYINELTKRKKKKLQSTLTPECTLMFLFYWCQENFDLGLSVNLNTLTSRIVSYE
jgi:hypothetical protein